MAQGEMILGVSGLRVKGSWGLGMLLALTLACCFPAQVSAQAAAPVGAVAKSQSAAPDDASADAPLSREKADALVAGMSDEAVRERLRDNLAQHEPVPAPASFLARLAQNAPEIRAKWLDLVAAVPEVVQLPAIIHEALAEEGGETFGHLMLGLFIAVAVGFAVEYLLQRAFGTGAEASEDNNAGGSSKVESAVVRSLIGLFFLAAFAVGTLMTIVVFGIEGTVAHVILASALTVVMLARAFGIVSRVLLAPYAPEARLIPVEDAVARTAHWQVVLLVSVMSAAQAVSYILVELDMAPPLRMVSGLLASLPIAVTAMGLIWYWREGVARLIATASDVEQARSPALVRFAASWHVLAIAYVIGIWIVATLYKLATDNSAFWPGMGSLFALLLIPIADLALRSLARSWFGPDEPVVTEDESGHSLESGESPGAELPEELDRDGDADEPGAMPAQFVLPQEVPADGGDYEALALRNMRMLLWLAVVLVLARLWNLDLQGIATNLVGVTVATAAFDIGVTLLLAYALWSVVTTAVARHAGQASDGAGHGPEGDGGGAGASRLQTLLPLMRKFLMVSLVVMVVMVALSSVGVDIGPLLAGAGMVGIAIGFGAQTLVRDIVSGLFFLIDDAFRMGEYVEVGDIRGAVEKISIRSMQLRHHNGPVHTLPFGEITQLTNYSRDWNIMKFELRLSFEEDIENIRKIIKKIGQSMLDSPEFGPMMLGPLKSQGVNRMDDSALIIRCKVMCLPGQQFMVRREAYTRIQRAFEENGIHFAPRRVIVESATPAQAMQAAADIAETIEEREAKAKDQGANSRG